MSVIRKGSYFSPNLTNLVKSLIWIEYFGESIQSKLLNLARSPSLLFSFLIKSLNPKGCDCGALCIREHVGPTKFSALGIKKTCVIYEFS